MSIVFATWNRDKEIEKSKEEIEIERKNIKIKKKDAGTCNMFDIK